MSNDDESRSTLMLEALLPKHSWRMLRAIAWTRHWPFDSDWRKPEALTYMKARLADATLLNQALDELPTAAGTALQALHAAGGAMPAERFLARFGPLSPYRPWRKDSPPAPWRYPASPAERLYYLGLIFPTTEAGIKTIVVPDEVRAMLPPVVQPIEQA